MSRTVSIDPILLSKVSKPARYVGGEWNSVVKNHDDVKLTVAYCFPDVYEVAMSHLGLRILYALLNERDDVAAERVYAPWPDMERAMRESGTPIWALESKRGLRDFDAVGFTLQYELSYTNILTILDLAGIPFRSERRGEDCPLAPRDYDLLVFFLENPNRIFTRDQLLIRFWGYDFDGNERVIDNHIKKLRKALRGTACTIRTERKSGYRMEISS